MTPILIFIISYFIGNINPSILISKWIKNIDIRDHNTKNAGASNTMMTLGLKWAIVVGLIDIFKGFIVVYVLRQLYDFSDAFSILSGLAVILGHIYPVFFQFKGGKGTATFFGLMLGLNPLVGILFILIFAASLFIFKYVAIASLIVVWLAPLYIFLYEDVLGISIIFMVLFAILSTLKHKSNLLNIIRHSETSVYDVLKKKK